ncbi:uncharacterized protein LOC113794814 [Dermatophagoides pteronyssinus]|uniref:uncharacterized protein LOC113794814 n=1 Tax=Dermatophagoides pteronyssinus TaxID=6956 RepID=UPI003F67A914
MLSSLGYLIILAIVIESSTVVATNSTTKDEICERLRQNDGAHLNILAVGKTKKRLLLITSDFYVYDTPLESLDLAINKLYLKTQPMKMSEKYSHLYQDPQFERIKDVISIAWIMNDPDSDWICLTPRDTTGLRGVNYDIDRSEVREGWQLFSSDDNPIVLLSTNRPCQYYSLRFHDGLLMNRWHCIDGDRVRTTSGIIQKYRTDSILCSDSRDSGNITAQRLVKDEQGNVIIRCHRGNPVNWPIVKGFVTDDKFYLFGRSNIYIFSEDVYHNQGKEYPVEKRSYDSFFNCAGIIPPSALSKSYFYLIMGAIILLLLILMIILWCILVTRRRHRRPAMVSLIHGKTTRSGLSDVLNMAKVSTNMAKVSTNMATTRSKSMTQQTIQSISRVSSHPNRPSTLSGGLSGGSAHVTARTGLDLKANSEKIGTSPSKPNQLKRLTIIPSSRHGGSSTA